MIDAIKMTSNADTGFGKDSVCGILVTMENHVACMVVDDSIRVSYCIIYQAVTFGDSLGGWF